MMFLEDLGASEVTLHEDEGVDFEELGMAWLTKHRRMLAPRTTARRLTSLRSYAKWAGYPALFHEYTAPDGGPAMPHPLPEGMAGVRRLIASANTEMQRCLIALMGMCGLRVAEAISITFTDCMVEGGKVTLRIRGKGDVVRYVPVSDEAYTYIVRRMVETALTGEPLVAMKDRYARQCVTDIAVRAKLSRRVASHDLRATFATAVYDKTKDQRLVQILLGHKSGTTTEGYIGVSRDKMIDGVEGL